MTHQKMRMVYNRPQDVDAMCKGFFEECLQKNNTSTNDDFVDAPSNNPKVAAANKITRWLLVLLPRGWGATGSYCF